MLTHPPTHEISNETYRVSSFSIAMPVQECLDDPRLLTWKAQSGSSVSSSSSSSRHARPLLNDLGYLSVLCVSSCLLFASTLSCAVVPLHSVTITLCLCNKTFRAITSRVSRFRSRRSSPHSDRGSRIWSLRRHKGFFGIEFQSTAISIRHSSLATSSPSRSLLLHASAPRLQVSCSSISRSPWV